MTQKIAGPGLGLPLPQNLYPTQLANAPYDQSTNKVALAPGDTLPIPAGEWFINTGNYCLIQYKDPVTGDWSLGPDAAWAGGQHFVISDGFNVRVANLLGCPVSAVVAAPGSAYVQATTTVSPTPGNSTWLPIIGGQLTPTVISAGAGYGMAPEIFIPAPPPASNNANGVGGLPASAFATIASGTINLSTGVSMLNSGAGYPSPFTIALLPCPTDPNISSGITLATVVFSVTGTGSIAGAICTNPGAPISNPNQITLTITGAGSGGSLSANVLQTVIAASVTGAGTGYGTVAAMLSTIGGVPAAGSIAASPYSLGLAWRPRPAQIALTTTGAAGSILTQVGTIYDGGMFLTSAAPSFWLGTNLLSAPTQAYVAPTIALTMGARADIITIQPAP